jgi:acetate kinase
MVVLTVNCGSSSLKCALVESSSMQTVRANEATLERRQAVGPVLGRSLDSLFADLPQDLLPHAVAHRIVHGGTEFATTTKLDDVVIARLAALSSLAPLHMPSALEGIRAARERLPGAVQVAIFDTAFHASLPAAAREYALPPALRHQFGIRRYGFHGLAHASVARHVRTRLGAAGAGLKIISFHLGSGASACAIKDGRSIETSMGFTPLEGLVMSTRSGDLDTGIVLEVLKSGAMDLESLEALLLEGSGLLGMTGTPDLREVELRAAAGERDCALALEVYGHRIRKYLGAYAVILGGVDVIAFTGGVGENDAAMRQRCLQDLEFMGARLDCERNWDAKVDARRPVAEISADGSRVRLLVVAANEALEMALQTDGFLAAGAAQAMPAIKVAVSARHAHLNQETIETLFGRGYQLQPAGALAQPGQFAAREVVDLQGPHGRLEHVRLIGPPRDCNQVEISRSDEFALGIDAPLRLSGDLKDSPGVRVEGPAGAVQLDRGLICARRHLHMSRGDARVLGVADGTSVRVRVGSDGREAVLEDVRVRVSEQFATELHLDTDEANAVGVRTGDTAQIVTAVR